MSNHWVDCPCCGTKGSMEYRHGIECEAKVKGYLPIKVGPLDGHFCNHCNDGFYTKESAQLRESQIAKGIEMQLTNKAQDRK